MVRRNGVSAQNAASFMSSVDQRVVDANNTLADMIVSMQEIGKSSGRISKIIRVIDEIAFQTNILALNAAVEAARAGQGIEQISKAVSRIGDVTQRTAASAEERAAASQELDAQSHPLVGVVGELRKMVGVRLRASPRIAR
jgi:methyl-accepting chemotaxis protein